MKRDQPSSASCDGCSGAQQVSFLLHNIRYRTNQRRFCTNCVLKNHQGLFCPICFDVYDDNPPPHLRIMCLKCPSLAHRSCVVPSSDSGNTNPAFLCPPCADPKFCYFKLKDENPSKIVKANGEGNSVDLVTASVQTAKNFRAIGLESAKVLVAAARIAATSMSKAAAAARIDAERRCKEAALARKRAREALEQVAYLVAKEKDVKRVST